MLWRRPELRERGTPEVELTNHAEPEPLRL